MSVAQLFPTLVALLATPLMARVVGDGLLLPSQDFVCAVFMLWWGVNSIFISITLAMDVHLGVKFLATPPFAVHPSVTLRSQPPTSAATTVAASLMMTCPGRQEQDMLSWSPRQSQHGTVAHTDAGAVLPQSGMTLLPRSTMPRPQMHITAGLEACTALAI
jgi:hypothetical protein